MAVKSVVRFGETHLEISNKEGITVGELQLIIATLIANNPKAVHTKVSLCLPEVETYVTRIVRANNEGDDSVFWLHTDRDAEKILVSGFKAS